MRIELWFWKTWQGNWVNVHGEKVQGHCNLRCLSYAFLMYLIGCWLENRSSLPNLVSVFRTISFSPTHDHSSYILVSPFLKFMLLQTTVRKAWSVRNEKFETRQCNLHYGRSVSIYGMAFICARKLNTLISCS